MLKQSGGAGAIHGTLWGDKPKTGRDGGRKSLMAYPPEGANSLTTNYYCGHGHFSS